MPTALMSCESLVNSPAPPLHLRCCDEDSCELIANSDLSARAAREMSTALMSCESLINSLH